MTDEIIFEERGAVAHVRLERPAKRNALTRGMLERLGEIFAGVEARRDLRAVILSGAGRDFCAGTDISELEALDEAGAHAKAARGQEVCERIELCGTPVVAAVRGAAAGAGGELALACHLRVAARDARFSLPEARLGCIPAYGGTQRLARALGTGRALSAMLVGDEIDAEEALGLGLVNRVVAPGTERDAAIALAQKVALKSAYTVKLGKEAFYRQAEMNLTDAYRYAAEVMTENMMARDAEEGIGAFIEKRDPTWQDK